MFRHILWMIPSHKGIEHSAAIMWQGLTRYEHKLYHTTHGAICNLSVSVPVRMSLQRRPVFLVWITAYDSTMLLRQFLFGTVLVTKFFIRIYLVN